MEIKVHEYESKTLDKALETAKEELNAADAEIILLDQQEKEGLLRSKVQIKVILKTELLEFIKSYIKEIIELMGISVNLEVKNQEDKIRITLISDNNSLLIGKEGKNLQALEHLLNQTLYNNFQYRNRIILDVGEYKQKKQKIIEMIAIKTAKKVVLTKKSIKLEPMNAYERRIVHTKLVAYDVETESEGEEPNRRIIISAKEK